MPGNLLSPTLSPRFKALYIEPGLIGFFHGFCSFNFTLPPDILTPDDTPDLISEILKYAGQLIAQHVVITLRSVWYFYYATNKQCMCPDKRLPALVGDAPQSLMASPVEPAMS